MEKKQVIIDNLNAARLDGYARKVEYWIDECMDCPFYEDDGEKGLCHETSIGNRMFEYPDKNNWFPEWCPLEGGDKEKGC